MDHIIQRHISLMCNGCKGHTNRHLIDFLVYCNKGTMFCKSNDATNISRDANYHLTVIDRVVENRIGKRCIGGEG